MTLTQNQKRMRLLLMIYGAALVLVALSRTSSILYSVTATDVIYRGSVLPTMLKYLADLFSYGAQGVSFGGIAYAWFYLFGPWRPISLAMSVGLLAVEQISALFADIFAGDIEGNEELAAVWSIVTVAYFALFCVAAYIASFISVKKQTSVYSAVRISAFIMFAVHFIIEAVNIVVFFIEYNFYVTSTEVASMVGNLLYIILTLLIIISAAGIGTVALANKLEARWTTNKTK